MTGIETEVQDSIAEGARQLTFSAIKTELATLGYEIDPGTRCACVARNLTTGNSYPCVTFGIRETDTKQSAFHFESRRDGNFRYLQRLRQWTFSVSRGAIVHI